MESTSIAVAVRQRQRTLKDKGKKPNPAVSLHPTIHRQQEYQRASAQSPPAAQTSHPLPLMNGHRVPPWFCCTSDTKISPRSWEQAISPSLVAEENQQASQLYRDFLNQLKSPHMAKLGMLTALSRQDTIAKAALCGKITLETNPSHCNQ